jgi:Ca2+-binding EF-hand superfamily protein
MKHKPYNRPITGDFFVGTFFITTSKQVNEDEVEYVSLTDEQIKYAKRLFTLDTEMSAMKSAKLQDLMKKLFPQIKKYPMNSMTPNISRDDDNKIVVSMLALADDEMIQDFVKDTDGKVDIEINCYLEKNKNNIGRDLVIRFNFYYPTGHPIFESVIYGDLLDRQKDFIEALMRVDNIMVWVVDKHHKVRKVIQTTWDYRPSAKLFNELLEG